MSVLVVQIPPRRRLGPQATAATEPDAGSEGGGSSLPAEFFWVRTGDGQSVDAQGVAAPSRMPRSEAVVLVLGECDVGWHRLPLPRAPQGKLRAALLGALEDNLLTDADQVHVALAPGATPGERAWVAAIDKAWIGHALAAFERRGVMVDRVVPSLWPGDPAHGHFYDASTAGGTPEPAVAMADSNGIACLPIAGTLARALLPAAAAQAIHWSAPPAVAAAAERWLGEPVHVRSPADQLLAAARSTWNLRQFDLSPRRRGTLALRDALRRFMRPAWRPVRLGLAGLIGLQVVAVNVWAWSTQQAIESKRQAQAALLAEAHPQVRVVVDAAAQMERETDRLRAAAGRPGAGDLEAMLAVASAAWPDGRGPMQSLRFQTGQLSLAAEGWSPDDVRQFTERLRPAGWAVASQDGRLSVTRAATR